MDARGWLRPSLLHLNELSPIIWILRLKGKDRDLAAQAYDLARFEGCQDSAATYPSL